MLFYLPFLDIAKEFEPSNMTSQQWLNCIHRIIRFILTEGLTRTDLNWIATFIFFTYCRTTCTWSILNSSTRIVVVCVAIINSGQTATDHAHIKHISVRLYWVIWYWLCRPVVILGSKAVQVYGSPRCIANTRPFWALRCHKAEQCKKQTRRASVQHSSK